MSTTHRTHLIKKFRSWLSSPDNPYHNPDFIALTCRDWIYDHPNGQYGTERTITCTLGNRGDSVEFEFTYDETDFNGRNEAMLFLRAIREAASELETCLNTPLTDPSGERK